MKVFQTRSIVLTLSTVALVASASPSSATMMKASWYGDPQATACGPRFNPSDVTAVAHRTMPCGTRLIVTNPKTGATLHMVVKDRGPYVAGVHLDVSRAAAERLGFKKRGHEWLHVIRVR